MAIRLAGMRRAYNSHWAHAGSTSPCSPQLNQVHRPAAVHRRRVQGEAQEACSPGYVEHLKAELKERALDIEARHAGAGASTGGRGQDSATASARWPAARGMPGYQPTSLGRVRTPSVASSHKRTQGRTPPAAAADPQSRVGPACPVLEARQGRRLPSAKPAAEQEAQQQQGGGGTGRAATAGEWVRCLSRRNKAEWGR